ncbi:MAG: hypothetical protein AAGI38_24275 [Bacteroidota bacterium]
MNRQMTIILTSLFVLILSCSTNEIKDSRIANLLPEGTYEFEVLDSVDSTPRQEELAYAFQKAYQQNMDIFNQYFEKARNNEESSFPDNDFLTEEDFKEYLEYASNIKLIPSTTEFVRVEYSRNKIVFESGGKLDVLNYLTFNTSTNSFQLENYNLTFRDSSKIVNRSNAFNESWNGYTWEFADPKATEMPTQETINSITAKQYKVTIGTLEQSGKKFMILKGGEYENGERLVNFEIPIRTKK